MKVLKKIFKGITYCFTNMNENNWVYKIVALIGLIIRVVVLPMLLPDIFEIIASFFISNLNFAPWLYELTIRIILLIVDALALSNIFYWISFFSVGNSYESGSEPWWGSVCYLVYYFMYLVIPIILIQNFLWWVIILVFVIYAIITFLIYFVSYKMQTLSDLWIWRLIIHVLVFILVVIACCLLKIYIF